MRCGREVDGVNEAAMGVCPAWSYWTFQGKNRGLRAGRYCWNVAGTFREDEPRCSHAEEFGSCAECGFYQLVKEEEAGNFEA